MIKYFTKINLTFIIIFFSFISCTTRDRDNPLDPESNGNSKLSLSVLSHNERVELKWNKSNLNGFIGYNLYRKDHPNSQFNLIANLISPNITKYTDLNVSFNNTYSYYITIQGENNESSPSNTVVISPGPGYNWIVDYYGDQIVKITYDARYKISHYYTDWRPEDIAIDAINGVALITLPVVNKIDIINTNSVHLETEFTDADYYYIDIPYLAEFESKNKMFWISDSAGAIYRISSLDYSINLIQSNLIKPDEIFINSNEDIVYIIDDIANTINQFSINGNFIGSVSQIGNHNIINPIKFVLDSTDNQFWLIERSNEIDYLYTGFLSNSQISLVDSFDFVFDINLRPVDQTPWLAIYEDGNSSILQLSKGGNRQLELTGYINPINVTHNPYDGSLIVTDSGTSSRNCRIVHYNEDFDILGIFTNLNFPIRVEVE